MKKLKLILTSCAIVLAVIAAVALRENSQAPAEKSKTLQKNLTDSANFLHP
jgi:hypothetical protein